MMCILILSKMSNGALGFGSVAGKIRCNSMQCWAGACMGVHGVLSYWD